MNNQDDERAERLLRQAKIRDFLIKHPMSTCEQIGLSVELHGGDVANLREKGYIAFKQKKGQPAQWYAKKMNHVGSTLLPPDLIAIEKKRMAPQEIDPEDSGSEYWDKLFVEYVPSWERQGT